MLGKPKLMLDLCGVVFDVYDYMNGRVHDIAYKRGIPIIHKDEEWNMEERMGPELKRIFFEDLYEDYLRNGRLMPFAQEYEWNLYTEFEIHLVTARGTMGNSATQEFHKNLTRAALMDGRIAFDYLMFTDNKTGYVSENEILFAVDDCLKTCINIKERTKCVPICFMQGHNRLAPDFGIKRAATWPHLVQILESMLAGKKGGTPDGRNEP